MIKQYFSQLLFAIRDIILYPDDTFEQIKKDNTDIVALLKAYALPIYLIPALCAFIQHTVIGEFVPWKGSYQVPITSGMYQFIFGIIWKFITLFGLALGFAKFSTRFQIESDFFQTFKLVLYATTPYYISGIFVFIPLITFFTFVGGFIWSVYLLFIGLPKMLLCPSAKRKEVTGVLAGAWLGFLLLGYLFA